MFRRMVFVLLKDPGLSKKRIGGFLVFPNTQQRVHTPIWQGAETQISAATHEFVKLQSLNFCQGTVSELHLSEGPNLAFEGGESK